MYDRETYYIFIDSTSTRPSLVKVPTTNPRTPPCSLNARMSSTMTPSSFFEYRKSPTRGRIITFESKLGRKLCRSLANHREHKPEPTINGRSTVLRIDRTRPNVAVVPPPAPRFEHTSNLSAPALAALHVEVFVDKVNTYSRAKTCSYQRDGRFHRVDTDFNDQRIRNNRHGRHLSPEEEFLSPRADADLKMSKARIRYSVHPTPAMIEIM